MDIFNKYLRLRDEIDNKVETLSLLHKNNMVCKAGCDSCCYNFKVFPVEFYAIKKASGLKGDFSKSDVIEGNERCQFLKNNKCTIYQYRPIICRTHGLPLLNMNEEGTNWILSACELNFTDVENDYFNEENVYMQDMFNSKLFKINKEFIENYCEYKFNEMDLIPLKSLLL
ncbi:MAG: YkgJ family cysteine cluster protein [Bacteroidales bacterium]|nr:YkgJ family cysteine cluster protein [Bacteroidales bacterium]